MKRIALAVFAACLFTLTACGAVESGEVYDKSYEPARDWEEEEADYQYLCQYEYGIKPDGKSGYTNVCKNRFVGYKTVQKHEDECWRLDFKNEDGDKGSACVSETTYNSTEIGEWYGKDKGNY